MACLKAYRIRLHAVNTFGHVIHEFDPWFNFRATQYLSKQGWYKFFSWYDYMSWYPIGRPIGTTIYPGMQITSVAIHELLKRVPKATYKLPAEVKGVLPPGSETWLPGHGVLKVGPMTLNDVCCMVPAWFGALATLAVALLTAEASGSNSAGVVAAMIMAIIPAHMMRSAAGEFDNECVAITTFCLTFWLWCRALRTPRSWPFGLLAGLAYVYAVATWGGYIFVINLIGLHAALIVALGKYNWGVYWTYTLFFAVGTAGATRVPVVSWAPLRSMEQVAPLLVFLVYQVMGICDVFRHCRRQKMGGWAFFFFRAMVFAIIGAVLAVVCIILWHRNYFGPLSARIRGLFMKHQKTGNPLVDSVAEHSATRPSAYKTYLHHGRYAAVLGLVFCWHQRSPAKFFPVLYAMVAYHFSGKMSRLMLICGPIVSVMAGFPVGVMADWCIEQLVSFVCGPRTAAAAEESKVPPRTGGIGSIYRTVLPSLRATVWPRELQDAVAQKDSFRLRWPWVDGLVRLALAAALVSAAVRHGTAPATEFVSHCEEIARVLSNPKIVYQAQQRNGEQVIINDYLDGYKWLKKNTPADARVMAWWDYGYQITGIGNRTSIADGNTWNHEHIATLGRTLTNPEKKAHNIMRHLADYVLVWAGGRSDDLAKSPHLARIANSIFPDVCGADDPTCRKFGFKPDGTPTPMMADSFLYKAVKHKLGKGVALDSRLFKEVHTSVHGLLRIFQVLNVSAESKAWIADPANRVCDAPGSWYCVGQYPPALNKLIASRQNFAQLEDFNKKGQAKSAYTKMVERNQREGRSEL